MSVLSAVRAVFLFRLHGLSALAARAWAHCPWNFRAPNISCILSFSPVYRLFSLTLAVIEATVCLLPRIITQSLALVTAVYRRFLLNSPEGPLKSGRITAGYSDPWDLCTVTA